MMERPLAWVRNLLRTDFRRNTVWFVGLAGIERIISMVQTILVARVLGITEYGVYGLLFGTIGLVASIAGLQMGLTATVFVARYKELEKAKAAAVIEIVNRFGWIVAATIFILLAPFASNISLHLLGSPNFSLPVLLGILFAASGIISGVQDGAAEGFELFGPLAKLKVATSALVLLAILPMAQAFGLAGVLLAILAGVALKYVALKVMLRRLRSALEIPGSGTGVSFRLLVSGFALPSMLVSLGTGTITWLGMYLLSRQPAGFDAVAIVNTGLQWRGPVLLLATTMGAVAVPAFSRLHASGDAGRSAGLRWRLSLFNFAMASGIGLLLTLSSGVLLSMYGEEFAHGRLPFSLIVLSTIPMVVSQVYMQHLVGTARMWRQLWLHCPYLIVMCGCFLLLVPKFHEVGYAVSLLAGGMTLLLHVLASELLARRRQALPSIP